MQLRCYHRTDHARLPPQKLAFNSVHLTRRAAIPGAVPPTVSQGFAFVAAIGLSAFLLFTLELLAGRLVLPVFGGAPSVWTTTLCFFTTVLFLGYLYAHFAATRLSFRTAAIVQLCLAAIAVIATIVTPANVASLRMLNMPPALNVLLALGVIAGAPAFLLATTTPLLSAWYTARWRNPWWLFAVSNGASFIALLAYPFVIEPSIGRLMQRRLLAAGLVAYAVGLVAIFFDGRRAATPMRARSDSPPPALAILRQLIWLLAALVPAGLLSATTNFIQTDLISAPLIWIGPLAIYLLSFVVAFAHRARYIARACEWLAPVAAVLLWFPFLNTVGWSPLELYSGELLAFFVFAVAIHSRLAANRPDARLLTRFYLIITAGGALGTAFVALVAPVIFSTIYEYPILIAGGIAALALLPRKAAKKHGPTRLIPRVWRLLPYAAVAVVLYALLGEVQIEWLRYLLLGGAIVLAFLVSPLTLPVAAPLALSIVIMFTSLKPLAQVRNFFGIVQVRAGRVEHVEFSGMTLHGIQFIDNRRRQPTSYYVRNGPLGDIFTDLRARTQDARIGVVGLGAGAIAAYAQPGDQITFYEINPAVVKLARDTSIFTYLADAPVVSRIVQGDGRLSLQAEPAGSFDLLVLDAFSSDAVPAHLLTAEAMQNYRRVMRPGGVLVYNLTNRFYDLATPLAATAQSLGLAAAIRKSFYGQDEVQSTGAQDSDWLVVGDFATVSRLIAKSWQPVNSSGPALTDDFSDLTHWLHLGSL
jgi:SAM-dependent methyltransferase